MNEQELTQRYKELRQNRYVSCHCCLSWGTNSIHGDILYVLSWYDFHDQCQWVANPVFPGGLFDIVDVDHFMEDPPPECEEAIKDFNKDISQYLKEEEHFKLLHGYLPDNIFL